MSHTMFLLACPRESGQAGNTEGLARRAGRVQIGRDGSGTVWVGGASVTCVQGPVHL